MFLPPPEVLDFFPDYRTTQIAWQGLAPVAAWAIWSLKPGRVVELGSYRGDSFFAFLDAASQVPELREIVAVDSWTGDKHTGPFTGQVYAQFHDELERRGDHRVRSIRALFSDAATQFEEGSIDMLHIDGAHEYDAVKLDFEQWLPKMSPNGVVLFHDTMVTDPDFGVWQVWAEIEAAYPNRTFNFEHSNGLGVLFLGDDTTGDFRQLALLPPREAAILRDTMRLTGEAIVNTTRYEYLLITRNGGAVDVGHIYSRGHDRTRIERLRSIEATRLETHALNAWIEQWFNVHKGDLTAALVEPSMLTQTKLLREEFEGQLQHHVARLEQLLAEQGNAIRLSLEPLVIQALTTPGGSLGPALASFLAEMSREKNDAQDDSIMSLGSKADAQDQAIDTILNYIRRNDPRFTS
ncbi:class I SAM-dependent methyltransferase [Devosia sp. XJ19-1]|uniref:Class I SAM-dependent methyltransferase n=1 Tax=Devosia ureilytica TaxID=2952754 RepID=A0A9Q4AM63_9HYPH|nr:class I SAM-dependent methyltransferase [Devosia ureilytica]MCP8883382.1 class I SAM-dependent methyltransferase [Devosia ureilytica]MCP8886250.1 class I SAM-dependent methyltransferase [Devosia ureilytica]